MPAPSTSDYSTRTISRSQLILLLLVALVGIASTIGLGNWQSRRGDDKAARQASWDAAIASEPVVLDSGEAIQRVAARLPQRVRVSGRLLGDATVFIDNRLVDGMPGYYVVTPIAAGSDLPLVLVNRGWVPRDLRAPEFEARMPSNAPTVMIEGIAVERVPRVLELADTPRQLRGAWPNLDYDAYQRAAGRPVARFVVQQTNDSGDGLRRTWPRPDTGVDRHRGYAFQWYALSALIAVMTVVVGGRALRSR